MIRCKECEAWLSEAMPPAVTIETAKEGTKKRWYFFDDNDNENSIGMIEILDRDTKKT